MEIALMIQPSKITNVAASRGNGAFKAEVLKVIRNS